MAETSNTEFASRLEARRQETLSRMDASDETVRVAREEKIVTAIDASEKSERMTTAEFFSRNDEA